MRSVILRTLLHPSPTMHFSQEEVSEYNELISNIYAGQLVLDNLSFPKQRFLHYLTLNGDFVFHGSNNIHIDTFEPRKQTLFNGELTEAVFASSTARWSMFYAVFDRDQLVGGFRNGCLIYKNKRYHYYSFNELTMNNNPWTSGKIYIFPKQKFTPSDSRRVRFDEWICNDTLRPISQLAVSVSDFYFKDKVSTHLDDESMVKTLLLYKMRTL